MEYRGIEVADDIAGLIRQFCDQRIEAQKPPQGRADQEKAKHQNAESRQPHATGEDRETIHGKRAGEAADEQ